VTHANCAIYISSSNQVINFILERLQIITDLCTMSGELKKKDEKDEAE